MFVSLLIVCLDTVGSSYTVLFAVCVLFHRKACFACVVRYLCMKVSVTVCRYMITLVYLPSALCHGNIILLVSVPLHSLALTPTLVCVLLHCSVSTSTSFNLFVCLAPHTCSPPSLWSFVVPFCHFVFVSFSCSFSLAPPHPYHPLSWSCLSAPLVLSPSSPHYCDYSRP